MKNINLCTIVKAVSKAFILSAMALCFPLFAQGEKDGGIDPAFNLITYGEWGKFENGALLGGMALQPDGKIVLVGSSNGALLTLRYDSDGIQDTTFGAGGVVTYGTSIEGNAVAIQPDGRIVVVGSSSDNNLLILRYNSNGTSDTTFGIDGVATYGGLGAGALVISQPDGKIIVVGNGSIGLFVLRWNNDGMLDTNFGVNGVAIYDNGVASRTALQGNGKIVVVGKTGGSLLLLRFNNDGTIDNGFGINGVVTYEYKGDLGYSGSGTAGYGVAIQNDGDIIVVGEGNSAALIARYKSDGILGEVDINAIPSKICFPLMCYPLGRKVNKAVTLLSDGNIIVIGTSYSDNPEDHSLMIGGGMVNSEDINLCIKGSSSCQVSGESVAIQSDGKVLIAGIANESIQPEIFVIRYLTEQFEEISTPDIPTGPTTGQIFWNYNFLVGGSSSSLGHSLEYRFDWGDGTYSDWSSFGVASKSWNTAGVFNVKAQARCAIHQDFESDWSGPLAVNILFTEILSTPSVLFGPTTGITRNSYPFTTGGSTSNLGHSVQYIFDWADGTNSGWLPVGTTSASHSWNTAGIYSVKVQARCATDTNVISSWSNSLTVNIGPITQSCTVTTNPSGLQIIVDGTTYSALQTFNWTPGSSHTLSVSSPQSGTAGTRYVYSSWSDGGAQNHTITAPSSTTTYTATFGTQYKPTINISPASGGTVNPSPMGDQSGIACIALVGVVCAGYYSSGTLVTLAATPNTGYTFSGWSGDLSGTANPTSVTMNGPKNVVANFTQDQYTLTANIAPPGSGSVSKTPDKGTYTYGQQVQLTATANPGYSFNNWSGDANGSSNSVTVTIDGNKNVIANFTQDQYTLTVNISPPGAGLVTKVPDKTTYVYGDVVTLTAAANPGYTFSNWSVDASGPANPITITMNGNKTITSNFTQNQYTLTMNINPTGSGSVTRNPNKSTYVYGDVVELTANAATGYSFSSWSGNVSGTTNPVTLTIDNNKTVTANFTEFTGADLTGSWTTPVTQTCKTTKKGPKCTITGTLTVENVGNRDASSSTVKFYLSDSNTYDQGDTPLMSAATGKIKAKQSKSIKLIKSFPLGQIVTDKYVIAVIDKYNSVKEIDETNNIITFGPIQ